MYVATLTYIYVVQGVAYTHIRGDAKVVHTYVSALLLTYVSALLLTGLIEEWETASSPKRYRPKPPNPEP